MAWSHKKREKIHRGYFEVLKVCSFNSAFIYSKYSEVYSTLHLPGLLLNFPKHLSDSFQLSQLNTVTVKTEQTFLFSFLCVHKVECDWMFRIFSNITSVLVYLQPNQLQRQGRGSDCCHLLHPDPAVSPWSAACHIPSIWSA